MEKICKICNIKFITKSNRYCCSKICTRKYNTKVSYQWHKIHYIYNKNKGEAPYDLIKARRLKRIIEYRKEILNCVICNVDISERHGTSKYCFKCSHKSKNYNYIYGKWFHK